MDDNAEAGTGQGGAGLPGTWHIESGSGWGQATVPNVTLARLEHWLVNDWWYSVDILEHVVGVVFHRAEANAYRVEYMARVLQPQAGEVRKMPLVARIVLAQYTETETVLYAQDPLWPSLRKWLARRYGAVETQAAKGEDVPPSRKGARYTSPNDWARAQFEAGKTERDIIREYTERYEQHSKVKGNLSTPPGKALRDLHARERKKAKKLT